MDILEQIINHKKTEVAERKSLYPVKLLERSAYFNARTVSLKHYVRRADKSGIIAEIKRKSPSRGVINRYADIEKISVGYMQAGASALSVLTDKEFFGGDSEDLKTARRFNYCPVLRKEFIIDEYQILEARSIGADAILLIAAILSPRDIRTFAMLAHSLQLEVLLEIHSREELLALETDVDLIGINNRDLRSFETSIEHSLSLAELIPPGIAKISESGIRDPGTALTLKKEGFDGFLIGEQFMRHSRPWQACAEFVNELNKMSDAD